MSLTPIKRRLEKFADRFKEEPTAAVPATPMPDDAWIDAVAARVIERLKVDTDARYDREDAPSVAPSSGSGDGPVYSS